MRYPIIKTHGHCYDGCGWQECKYWKHDVGFGNSRCMLLGGKDGVVKVGSKSLVICDKMYGKDYDGDV